MKLRGISCVCGGVVCWVVCATLGLAQTGLPSLNAMLVGKQMALRSYSADAVAEYSYENGTIVTQEPKVKAVGVFTTKSVSLDKNQLVFEGERAIVVQDTRKHVSGLNGKEAMRLRVDLHDAEPVEVIPKLVSLLFFVTVDAAVNALPAQVRPFLLYDVSHTRRSGERWVHENGQWHTVENPGSKLVQAVPVSLPDPRFSDQARKDKTNGVVIVVFEVTNTGSAKDIWLGNSVTGLTEGALVSVREYRFKPAVLDGRPVGVEILYEVNFRIF